MVPFTNLHGTTSQNKWYHLPLYRAPHCRISGTIYHSTEHHIAEYIGTIYHSTEHIAEYNGTIYQSTRHFIPVYNYHPPPNRLFPPCSLATILYGVAIACMRATCSAHCILTYLVALRYVRRTPHAVQFASQRGIIKRLQLFGRYREGHRPP